MYLLLCYLIKRSELDLLNQKIQDKIAELSSQPQTSAVKKKIGLLIILACFFTYLPLEILFIYKASISSSSEEFLNYVDTAIQFGVYGFIALAIVYLYIDFTILSVPPMPRSIPCSIWKPILNQLLDFYSTIQAAAMMDTELDPLKEELRENVEALQYKNGNVTTKVKALSITDTELTTTLSRSSAVVERTITAFNRKESTWAEFFSHPRCIEPKALEKEFQHADEEALSLQNYSGLDAF
jgi:hypothetical protein